jgi:hypothetical protein
MRSSGGRPRKIITIRRGGDLYGREIRKGLRIERRIPGSGPFRTRPVSWMTSMSEAKSIKFQIPGDPVGYTRMTQAQVKLLRIARQNIKSEEAFKIIERLRKYLAYKDLVWYCSMGKKFDRSPRAKTCLNVMIYFRDGERKFSRHPDPENVRKGIQDALFSEDNKVAGSVDFGYDPGNPRVEVEIIEP